MFIFKRIMKSMQKTERECDELHDQLQRDREYINAQYMALINAQIEFQDHMKEVSDPFSEYLEGLKEWIDAETRLEKSVELAREAGLPEDKILHNMEEGERFFCS